MNAKISKTIFTTIPKIKTKAYFLLILSKIFQRRSRPKSQGCVRGMRRLKQGRKRIAREEKEKESEEGGEEGNGDEVNSKLYHEGGLRDL